MLILSLHMISSSSFIGLVHVSSSFIFCSVTISYHIRIYMDLNFFGSVYRHYEHLLQKPLWWYFRLFSWDIVPHCNYVVRALDSDNTMPNHILERFKQFMVAQRHMCSYSPIALPTAAFLSYLFTYFHVDSGRNGALMVF